MTRTQQISVPKVPLMEEIRSMLDSGCEVTLRAKGRSMAPYIRDGRDSLILTKADPGRLQIGDVVLAYTMDKRYVAHRIISISDDVVIIKGDGNLYGTEECRKADVFGRMIYLERDGKRIDCNTPGQRRKAAMMRMYWHPWLWLRGKLSGVKRRLLNVTEN